VIASSKEYSTIVDELTDVLLLYSVLTWVIGAGLTTATKKVRP
jgi:hypothetical protein